MCSQVERNPVICVRDLMGKFNEIDSTSTISIKTCTDKFPIGKFNKEKNIEFLKGPRDFNNVNTVFVVSL